MRERRKKKQVKPEPHVLRFREIEHQVDKQN